MRRELASPLAAPVLPDGVAFRRFIVDDAGAVHALLQLAYTNGGGSVAPFEAWWDALATDSEYDPGLCFTAWTGDRPVGVAQCWTSAFVKDLGVHPDWRGRGVGKALLLTAFRTFKERGALSVGLKVQAGNAGAIRFYEKMGMAAVQD